MGGKFAFITYFIRNYRFFGSSHSYIHDSFVILILLKGILFAHSSRLISYKANLEWSPNKLTILKGTAGLPPFQGELILIGYFDLTLLHIQKEVSYVWVKQRDGSLLSFLHSEVRLSSWTYYPRSEQLIGSLLLHPHIVTQEVHEGVKKERGGK